MDIKVDYFSVSDDEDVGTADSLRMISDRLKSDVLIVSCDLVSDVNLGGVLDVFRRHNASIASLLFHPQSGARVQIPGPKSKHKPGKFLKENIVMFYNTVVVDFQS